jgi:F0F1-type ATP synthase assembly protein I
MKFIPREQLTCQTHLSSKQVLEKLTSIVEPCKTFRLTFFWQKNKNHKPYEGKIEANQFEISRIIGYRNSFLPEIKGMITPKNKKTQIDLRLEMNSFVRTFVLFFTIVVSLFFISIAYYAVSNGHFTPIILVPLCMVVFGYIGVLWAFNYEAKKAKKDLSELWQTELKNS